jgi:hypothetical protein
MHAPSPPNLMLKNGKRLTLHKHQLKLSDSSQLVKTADWQLSPHCRPSEVANGPLRRCDGFHAAQPAFLRGSRR